MAIETIRTVVIDGHEYRVERGLAQSVPDGEMYVVESFPDGTVMGACGPLYYRDIKAAELWNYEMDPDLGEWVQQRTEAEDGPAFIAKDIEVYERDHASA